jgi:hypothetical protein
VPRIVDYTFQLAPVMNSRLPSDLQPLASPPMMSSGQLASSILQLALAMILRAFPDLSPSVTSAAVPRFNRISLSDLRQR